MCVCIASVDRFFFSISLNFTLKYFFVVNEKILNAIDWKLIDIGLYITTFPLPVFLPLLGNVNKTFFELSSIFLSVGGHAQTQFDAP